MFLFIVYTCSQQEQYLNIKLFLTLGSFIENNNLLTEQQPKKTGEKVTLEQVILSND